MTFFFGYYILQHFMRFRIKFGMTSVELITDSESSSECHLLELSRQSLFYLLIKYSATASYAGIETGSMYLFDESGFDANLTITISAVGSM